MVAAVMALAACGGPAEPPSGADASTCGRLQGVLDTFVAEGRAPGVAVTVGFADGSTWSGAAGVSDLESGAAMAPVDRFRIGSVTKTFTAALVMLLVEDGVLSLDDVVSRHLTGVPNGDLVTVRQLLQHTSGLADYLYDPAIVSTRSAPHTPAELLAVAQSLTPELAPGERYRYSNTNYVLLGLIVERVTGSTWAAEIRDRILDPTGLSDTFVYGWEEVPGGFVRGYAAAAGGGWDDVTLALHPTVAYAAGCMVSSTPDLVRWSQALHAGRVVSAASLETMKNESRVSEEYPSIRIGLGIFIESADEYGSFLGHAGGLDGFSTEVQLLDGAGHTVAGAFNATEDDDTMRLRTLMNNSWIAVLGL